MLRLLALDFLNRLRLWSSLLLLWLWLRASNLLSALVVILLLLLLLNLDRLSLSWLLGHENRPLRLAWLKTRSWQLDGLLLELWAANELDWLLRNLGHKLLLRLGRADDLNNLLLWRRFADNLLHWLLGCDWLEARNWQANLLLLLLLSENLNLLGLLWPRCWSWRRHECWLFLWRLVADVVQAHQRLLLLIFGADLRIRPSCSCAHTVSRWNLLALLLLRCRRVAFGGLNSLVCLRRLGRLRRLGGLSRPNAIGRSQLSLAGLANLEFGVA